jgi:tetratricopeptide (TPR) repeat protein
MSNIKPNFTPHEEVIDPVDGIVTKTQNFFDENKSAIYGGLIAVLVIVAALFGYGYYQKIQEQKAQVLLAKAQSFFTAADYSKALKGDETDFTPGLEQIIANYSGTDAANLATYYAAMSEFNLGNNDAALGYINKFDIPDGVLGVGPLAFKASVLVANGKYSDAASTYEKAANEVKTEQTTPLFLIEAAKAYLKAGNKQQAQRVITSVLDEYPTGAHSAEANRLKGQVTA